MRDISETIITTQCKPGSSLEAVVSNTLRNEQLDAQRLKHRVCIPNEIKMQVSYDFYSHIFNKIFKISIAQPVIVNLKLFKII